MSKVLQKTRDRLFALHRFFSNELRDLLRHDTFSGSAIKINEFDVFCVFLTSTACLRGMGEPPSAALEELNRSVLVAVIDRIIAARDEEMDEEQVHSLADTVTGLFIERMSAYRRMLQADGELADRGQDGAMLVFPSLSDGFLSTVLDLPNGGVQQGHGMVDAKLAHLVRHASRSFVD